MAKRNKNPDPKRSAAAKRAAKTRKRNREQRRKVDRALGAEHPETKPARRSKSVASTAPADIKIGTTTPAMSRVSLGGSVAEQPPPKSPEEAARDAASPNQEPATSTPGAAPPAAPVVTDSAALVELCELGVLVSVRVQSSRRGVPWEAAEPLAKLTAGERSTLQAFAPMAAPYLGSAMGAAPWAGAVAFGLIFVGVVAGRARSVAELAEEPQAAAPTRSPRSKPAQSGDETPERTPEQEWLARATHESLWGPCAPDVPMGTVPNRGGFPKPFKPKEEDAA